MDGYGLGPRLGPGLGGLDPRGASIPQGLAWALFVRRLARHFLARRPVGLHHTQRASLAQADTQHTTLSHASWTTCVHILILPFAVPQAATHPHTLLTTPSPAPLLLPSRGHQKDDTHKKLQSRIPHWLTDL